MEWETSGSRSGGTLADRIKCSSRTRVPPNRLNNDYNNLMLNCALTIVNKYKRESFRKSFLIKQNSIQKSNNVKNKSKNKSTKINGNKNIVGKSYASIATQFPIINAIDENEKIPKNESTIGVLRTIQTQKNMFEINKTCIERQICSVIDSIKQNDIGLAGNMERCESRLESTKWKKWCFNCLKQSHRNFNCCPFGHYCSFVCRAKHFIGAHCHTHQ